MQLQLVSAGDKKIQVIKVVREWTRWGLKEAKAWVDGAPNSAFDIDDAHADSFANDLRGAGATVKLSGAAAAAPAEADTKGVADELEELASLRDRGILTDAEFTAAKARLLGIS